MIQAIFFDCDGVLVDSEELLLETNRIFLKNKGLSYTKSEFKGKFLGLSGGTFLGIMNNEYKERLGYEMPQEHIDDQIKTTHEALDNNLETIENMLDLVAQLSHIPIAVVSNSWSTTLEKKLKQMQYFDHFKPHIYARDHVEKPKPAPDLYLHASKLVGIAPEHCLVIEDSPTGAAAAIAANMDVIGFCGGSHCCDKHPEYLRNVGVDKIAHDADELTQMLMPLIKNVA